MWLGLAFISAFLLGCYEVNKKISLDGNAVIPVLFFNTLISSLIFVPFIFLSFFTDVLDGTMLYVPRVSLETCGSVYKGRDRLVIVDIRLFCLEAFTADHYRAYQSDAASRDAGGSHACLW